MDFKYTPINLINARNGIERIHKRIREEKVPMFVDSDLKQLILLVVSWEKYSIKMNSLSLSDSELKAIVSYIPQNKFKVNLENLFDVYKYRSSEELADTLIYNWQDYYSNIECNKFFCDLLKFDEKFIILMRKMKINESEMQKVLISDNVPNSLGKIIYDKEKKKHSIAIERILEQHNIRVESRLGKDILALFYTFCDREEYMRTSVDTLLSVIKGYDVKVSIKAFLKNFLTELKLSDLEHFNGLLGYLELVTGKDGTDKFVSFFKGFDNILVRKYNQWLGINRLRISFGSEDERYQFWKQFNFEHIKYIKLSESLVFETPNYYFSEFLGEDKGPIYAYDKQYFNDKIKKYFVRENNKELRSTLYDKWIRKENGLLGREVHQGDWQGKVGFALEYTYGVGRIKDY